MALTNEDLQAIAGLLQPIHIRLDRMESRLDGVESRLDGVESRFDSVESRLDSLESDVSALKAGQAEMRTEIKKLDQKVSAVYELALEAWGKSTENRVWLEAAAN